MLMYSFVIFLYIMFATTGVKKQSEAALLHVRVIGVVSIIEINSE